MRDHLRVGLLKREPSNETAIAMYRRNALESVRAAEMLLSASPLWAIVCSYYAMFYAANAALRRLGYRVGDQMAHRVTEDALRVFVLHKLAKRLLADYAATLQDAAGLAQLHADAAVADFSHERRKRSRFQYETKESAKRATAETSLERARRFVIAMEKLAEPRTSPSS